MNGVNINNNIYVKQIITIINPDGTNLITTDNSVCIMYAMLYINHLNLSGYKIVITKVQVNPEVA